MFLCIILIIVLFVVSGREIEAAKKYYYVGCYETTHSSRLLYQHEKKFDELTPKICIDWCHSMHLAYAGLQKNECRCGQYQPNEMIRRRFRDCDYPCPGDSNTKCGGEHTCSIYETGIIATGDEAIPSRAYLGCYLDNDTHHRLLKGSIHQFPDNRPSKCHRVCYEQGFRFFGLSNVKYCFCGDTQASEEKSIPVENCHSICNGDETKYCGGNRKLRLYATGITNFPEFGRYVGCYDNTNFNYIKTEIMLDLTLTNSQGRCFNICDQNGFKYAGVQRGVDVILHFGIFLDFEDNQIATQLGRRLRRK